MATAIKFEDVAISTEGSPEASTSLATTVALAPLLQLLRFSSQSLPIGGFAWSQGLETAIDSSWLKSASDLEAWLLALLEHNFRWQELPLLQRLLAAGEGKTFQYWNQYSIACRETAELRQEDIQSGRALLKLLVDMDVPEALSWSINGGDTKAAQELSYVASYAIACRHYQIEYSLASSGLIWAWLDNQIAVAIKSFPMGQTDGQGIIGRVLERVPQLIADAAGVEDSELGISLPGQVLSSMLHETQYSRLFRS